MKTDVGQLFYKYLLEFMIVINDLINVKKSAFRTAGQCINQLHVYYNTH